MFILARILKTSRVPVKFAIFRNRKSNYYPFIEYVRGSAEININRKKIRNSEKIHCIVY